MYKSAFLGPPNKPKSISSDGVTLVELLLVISIVGILSAAVLGTINFRETSRRSRDSVKTKTLNELAQAVESYYSAESRYPKACTSPSGEPCDHIGVNSKIIISKYIAAWPSGYLFHAPPSDALSYRLCTPSDDGVTTIRYYSGAFYSINAACKSAVLIKCTQACSVESASGCTNTGGLACT